MGNALAMGRLSTWCGKLMDGCRINLGTSRARDLEEIPRLSFTLDSKESNEKLKITGLPLIEHQLCLPLHKAAKISSLEAQSSDSGEAPLICKLTELSRFTEVV